MGAAGGVHAVWEDGRHAGLTDVMVASSGDGGDSWSQPRELTLLDGSAAGGFNSAVAVNGDGVVGVLWYDKRVAPRSGGYRHRLLVAPLPALPGGAATHRRARDPARRAGDSAPPRFAFTSLEDIPPPGGGAACEQPHTL